MPPIRAQDFPALSLLLSAYLSEQSGGFENLVRGAVRARGVLWAQEVVDDIDCLLSGEYSEDSVTAFVEEQSVYSWEEGGRRMLAEIRLILLSEKSDA